MRSVPTPLDGLHEAVLAVAGDLTGPPSGKAGAPGVSGDAGGAGAEATATSVGRARGGIVLERPPRADFGDYSTNAALLLAPRLGAAPREVAERLGEELKRRLGASLERFEVAGPGFLNLFLADPWLVGS